MPPTSISKGIVFDLDETLIDRKGSLNHYARLLWTTFKANTDLKQPDFLTAFHNLDGNGRVARAKFFADLSETVFLGVTPDTIAQHFHAHAWLAPTLFPGVIDVINTFRQHSWPVGVVTNGGSHAQNSKLNNADIARHLDAYVISAEFGAKKPDPAIYAEIAQQLDIDPTTSWFVGDDPISDVVGPSRFGFNTAWLQRYLPWPTDQDPCYTYRITHIAELRGALLKAQL
jgi:putative hydrolase of the HAD superfamily